MAAGALWLAVSACNILDAGEVIGDVGCLWWWWW